MRSAAYSCMSSLVPKRMRARRAGLDAGRLQAHADAVRAQRALVGLVVGLADARHVERAAGDAVAAADAVLGDEVDDAVAVLARWRPAPGRPSGSRGRRSACSRPCGSAIRACRPRRLPTSENRITVHDCRGQVARVVVGADAWCPRRRAGRSTACRRPGRPCSRCRWTRRSAWRPAVPACGCACRATAWSWPSGAAMSRDCNEDMAGPQAFSMLTVNDLYSGVCVFASPTKGVSVFDQIPRLGHADEAPVVRQPHGVHRAGHRPAAPTMRLVTSATALMKPRLVDDLHQVAVGDALVLRELLADLDELLRLDDGSRCARSWSSSGSAP